MSALDDELRALLQQPFTNEAPPPALLALGHRALERLLDGGLFATQDEWRDWGANQAFAVAAFAKVDFDGVVRAMRKRERSDADIGLSGVGLLRDARAVPFVLAAYAESSPLGRREAIELLGRQRDPRATATVVRALRDRSPDVRLAAVRALGEIRDRETLEPLRAFAERHADAPLVPEEVARALRAIKAG